MTTAKVTAKRGKPKNIFLKENDVKRIRDLSAYLSAEGHRVSDSQVIAASLRVARADTKLLKAFKEGLLQDARFKREN